MFFFKNSVTCFNIERLVSPEQDPNGTCLALLWLVNSLSLSSGQHLQTWCQLLWEWTWEKSLWSKDAVIIPSDWWASQRCCCFDFKLFSQCYMWSDWRFYALIYLSDGELYSGTSADFMGRDFAIFRTLGSQHPIRTEQHDSRWLNGKYSDWTKFLKSFPAKTLVLWCIQLKSLHIESDVY